MESSEKTKVYTVSQLTRDIREVIESNFSTSVWVEGEVSNVRLAGSGHLYFTLKDENSQILAVFFGYRSRPSAFTLENGMKVLVLGSLTVYEKGGNYQISVKRMEPAGIGALQLAFEQLKKKLEAEGLFDPRHKRPIPLLPGKIGIVTSPTGAAFRDILNVLERRFSDVHIILAPVLVQGDAAPGQIAKAIELLNEMNEVEVIIVTRGGGSLEDLWAFNDEKVARAVYHSKIPVISAVGHEIDWTICDFVSDLRVPTPTASAELVIAKKADLLERIHHLNEKMQFFVNNKIQHLLKIVEHLAQHPVFKYPTARIEEMLQSLDLWMERSTVHLKRILDKKKSQLETFLRRLEALSPLAVLGRGYSLTRRPKDAKIIKNTSQIKEGEELETLLSKGSFISVVKFLKP